MRLLLDIGFIKNVEIHDTRIIDLFKKRRKDMSTSLYNDMKCAQIENKHSHMLIKFHIIAIFTRKIHNRNKQRNQ